VVIDGSDENHKNKFNHENVRYFHIKSEPNIPRKRNLAMKESKGEILTWFDDDDWQHPHKCTRLVEELYLAS
jgi:glycosyltransferase involved in cell wall biosynthesis